MNEIYTVYYRRGGEILREEAIGARIVWSEDQIHDAKKRLEAEGHEILRTTRKGVADWRQRAALRVIQVLELEGSDAGRCLLELMATDGYGAGESDAYQSMPEPEDEDPASEPSPDEGIYADDYAPSGSGVEWTAEDLRAAEKPIRRSGEIGAEEDD